MDEKTEELREIFMAVSENETVTESQESAHGSLAAREPDLEGVRNVLAEMRERYAFRTDFEDDRLARVVQGYFDGETDAEIADAVETDPETVSLARLDCHLIRDAELEPPFEHVRALAGEDHDADAIADELDIDPETAREHLLVLEARNESLAANERWVDALREHCTDEELGERLTEEVRESGLEDATEGMETDVSF